MRSLAVNALRLGVFAWARVRSDVRRIATSLAQSCLAATQRLKMAVPKAFEAYFSRRNVDFKVIFNEEDKN